MFGGLELGGDFHLVRCAIAVNVARDSHDLAVLEILPGIDSAVPTGIALDSKYNTLSVVVLRNRKLAREGDCQLPSRQDIVGPVEPDDIDCLIEVEIHLLFNDLAGSIEILIEVDPSVEVDVPLGANNPVCVRFVVGPLIGMIVEVEVGGFKSQAFSEKVSGASPPKGRLPDL